MALPIAFFLAAQAGGMIMDYMGTSNANAADQEAMRRQEEAINFSIATSRLQTEDASLQSMKELRQNLGTQAAIFAARGVSSASGVSILSSEESVSNFNADERMRRLNQVMNEKRQKAGLEIAKTETKAFKNKNWNAFGTRVINKIPTDPDVWKKWGDLWGS